MTAIFFLISRVLISISLYAFIFVLFYYLWKENKRQGNWLSNRKIPTLTLTIQAVDGPDQILHFMSDEVTIGRDARCDCKLDDVNVSIHHARLRYHHSQWWLEDLASKNGTIINHQPVITPVVVISGDEFLCGLHTLKITISNDILNTPVNKPSPNENGVTDD